MGEFWHRIEGESAKQYDYFSLYSEMGVSRSLERVKQECNKSASYLQKLSARHKWVERADAYDRHIEEISRKENVEAIKKANKENIQLAQMLKFATGKKIKHLIDKIKAAEGDAVALDEALEELRWNYLPSILNTATDIERRAYGMNRDILNVSVNDAAGDVELSISIKKKSFLEKLQAGEPDDPV